MDLFIEVLQKYGILCLVILLLVMVIIWLFQVIFDENKANQLRAQFFRYLSLATGRTDFDKKYITNDIKSKLNSACIKIGIFEDKLPICADIEFVETGDCGSYDLKDGEYIVRLDPSISQERNIVRLATIMVSKSFYPLARIYIEPEVQTAIDLNLVKKLLSAIGNYSALQWFFGEEYPACINGNTIVKTWNGKLTTIDERGLFANILLFELTEFGRRMFGQEPKPYMAGEIESLIDFLFKIANKQAGQNVPLCFERAHIHIAIVIIARNSTIFNIGIDPYIKRVAENLNNEVDRVYVVIFDKLLLGAEADEEISIKIDEFTDKMNKMAVNMDFEQVYSCLDTKNRKRYAKIIRYSTIPK